MTFMEFQRVDAARPPDTEDEEEMVASYDHALGTLEAQMKAVTNAITEVKQDAKESIERVEGKVDETNRAVIRIENQISEVRGGWKVLVGVSGLSGAVGAAVTKFLPFILTLR